MRRQLALKEPMLRGDDIKEIQRKLGMTGNDVDGRYGGFTAAAVEEWKWKSGYPSTRINSILGLWGQAMLFGDLEFPADYKERATKRRGQPFVPVKNGVARPIAIATTTKSEFRVPDGEEGPDDTDGKHYHGAKDWFAPSGTAVRAPVAGTITESRKGTAHTGQVFGGVVKIKGGDGKIWVFRHVEPHRVDEGDRVRRAQVVATVSRWDGGATHAHIEIWKTQSGGYHIPNMLDPMRFF